MVIPMSGDAKVRSKTKRIVGDGKRIIMRTNSDSILVIGSGNLVEVERNDGDIQVVGDGCRVSVTAGCGTIRYTGDGGYLDTGSMDLNKITYLGDGGRIVSGNGTSKSCYKNTGSDRASKARSCENVPSEHSEAKIVNGNVYVTNKTNCHINVPNLQKLTRIQVPKISLVRCKCKHC